MFRQGVGRWEVVVEEASPVTRTHPERTNSALKTSSIFSNGWPSPSCCPATSDVQYGAALANNQDGQS